ncbi:hypothetical protein FRC14_001229 [Serendipita sp. 396]|nr:hypothetical protein FRC14_001229 [Serendipita sp. 396]
MNMISKGLVLLCLTSWVAAQQSVWGQCGGINWTGPTTCVSGTTCNYVNDWYYQCIPSSTSSSTSRPSSSSSSTRSSSRSTSTTSSTVTSSPTGRVGKLPALGWNSWNAYQGNINEAKILAAANQFITLGLKDVGYQYVNIDDCWSNIAGRDSSTQRIRPDLSKFPNGISSVASKVHSLGLLLGIYGVCGLI